MLKKLVIPISIFILSGCGEGKQVTEEMLVGKWGCLHTGNEEISYDKDGKMDKKEVAEIEPQKRSITYVKDGDFLKVTFDNEEPITFSLEVKTLGEYEQLEEINYYEKKEDVKEFKFDTEFIFISDNEYKYIINLFNRYKESKQLTFKYHTEMVCKRI